MERNIKPILSELDINYQLYRDGQEQQLADTKKEQTPAAINDYKPHIVHGVYILLSYSVRGGK